MPRNLSRGMITLDRDKQKGRNFSGEHPRSKAMTFPDREEGQREREGELLEKYRLRQFFARREILRHILHTNPSGLPRFTVGRVSFSYRAMILSLSLLCATV